MVKKRVVQYTIVLSVTHPNIVVSSMSRAKRPAEFWRNQGSMGLLSRTLGALWNVLGSRMYPLYPMHAKTENQNDVSCIWGCFGKWVDVTMCVFIVHCRPGVVLAALWANFLFISFCSYTFVLSRTLRDNCYLGQINVFILITSQSDDRKEKV